MNLEILAQRNPFLMVVFGDFNAKSKSWCAQDNTNFGAITIENLRSQLGLRQLIKEATHVLESSFSCIELIFTRQSNLVVESGVHPSLHPNCHHQIVFVKFNLQIHYPPSHPWEIWHYKQANQGGSRTAATSKMERFLIIVNGWKPLTIITKHSILEVATVLDPPLSKYWTSQTGNYWL